ncbi:MAG: peptide ABC transporter substrate-binding protein [Chlamydiota bacterium]
MKVLSLKNFILWLLFLAAGCSLNPSLDPSCLRISFSRYPETLDPRKSGDFTSSTLICLLYEGLTRCLPDGTVEMALSQTVDLSEDQKIYTFHLRKAVWSDGEPITAFDFEKSWKKILDPSFPSACGYLLYPIKNGEKCAKGILPMSKLGIQAVDAHTFQVELERPTHYFLSLTAFPLFLPIPSHVEERDPNWSQKMALISSGPFLIKKLHPNSEIILEKNQKFWNRDQIFIKKIHISMVAEEMTAFHMFERGDLDWLGGSLAPLPPDALEILDSQDALCYLPSAATTICTFNTETFPFQNRSLRMAFSYAINRDEIVKKITQLGQLPATRCVPPSLFGNQNKALYPISDELAARIYFQKALKELNISAEELEPLTLYFKHGQIDKRLAQTLQKQWKEVLGVTVQLEQLDFKSHTQHLQKRDYQIALAFWIAQYNDPLNILERFRDRENLKNYSGWEDPDYAALLDLASFERDPQKRLEILEAAEALLADQMPIAPLYHWNNPSIHSPRIEEIATTPTGGILFERFRLKR